MVTGGPYWLVRHPMCVSVLYISLGLACLTQSLAYLAVFCVHVALLTVLVPMEEARLRQAYGQQYDAYRQKVHALFPLCW